MAKSKGDQANRQKRQWYVASKSGGKNHRWCTAIQLDPAIFKPKRRLLMSSAFGESPRWALHPKNGCDHRNTRQDEEYSTCLDCNNIAPLMQRCAFCSKPFEIPNGVWECHVEDYFCCMYCALACVRRRDCEDLERVSRVHLDVGLQTPGHHGKPLDLSVCPHV